MLKKSHIAVSEAVVSGGLLITHQPMPVDIIGILGTWIGVQLPDIDQNNTKVNRILGPIGNVFSKLKHRTWTHTLWAILLLLILSIFLPVPQSFQFIFVDHDFNYVRLLYFAITIGYLLHLIEDNFSRQGVCWTYPYKKFAFGPNGHPYKRRKKHWFYYRTGGNAELAIRTLAILINFYSFIQLFMQNYIK